MMAMVFALTLCVLAFVANLNCNSFTARSLLYCKPQGDDTIRYDMQFGYNASTKTLFPVHSIMRRIAEPFFE
jgi:hypothetical protein